MISVILSSAKDLYGYIPVVHYINCPLGVGPLDI